MNRFVVLITCLLLAGCASAPLTPAATPRVGESPALNQVVERSVGDVIYEIHNYRQLSGARLRAPANVSVFLARWAIDTVREVQASSR